MRNTTIAHVMTPAPATVESTASVIDAERLMREHACHHIPVVHGRKIVGIVSDHDLLKALALRPGTAEPDTELLRQGSLRTRRVAEVMQRNVRVLTETATLLDAARALGTGALHAVPVIAADGRLVGIVTSTDVIEALADDLQHAGAASPPRHDSGAERDTASASGAEVKALHDVFRAVRNYLASGRAETEHTRLVQAADRARDALRAAGIDLAR